MPEARWTNFDGPDGWCALPCWFGSWSSFSSYDTDGSLAFTNNDVQFTWTEEVRIRSNNEVYTRNENTYTGTYLRRGSIL